MVDASGLWGKEYLRGHRQFEDELRRQGPVHRAIMPDGLPVYVVFGYDAACEALRHPNLKRTASQLRRLRGHYVSGDQSGMFNDHVMFSDNDDRDRQLAVLRPWFSRERIAALETKVRRVTDETLGRLTSGATVDLVTEVAVPVPITVISELLGVPVADQGRMRRWTAALMRDDEEINGPASRALDEYFAGLIEDKRRSPADDLVSALVAAHGDGVLSDIELIGNLYLMIVAGHETTTNLISNGSWALLESGQWADLAADPGLLERAVEQLLAFDSPVRMTPHRYTTEPITIAGVRIPADQVVLVAISAANRDPTRFGPAVGELDIRRELMAPHVSFGYGARYCLGSQLARLEGRVVFGELTRRWPNTKLLEQENRPQESAIMSGRQQVLVHLHG